MSERISGKGEQSETFDNGYASSVYKHFGDDIRNLEALDPEGKDQSNSDYIGFLQDVSSKLSRLADPRRRATINPKESAPGILQLAKEMATVYPDSKDEALRESNAVMYAEAKGIFIATCEKSFPEIDRDSDPRLALDSELENLATLKILKKPNIEGKKGKALLQIIDKALTLLSDFGRDMAFEEYKRVGNVDTKKEERLLEISKSIYRLQLVRDRLGEEVISEPVQKAIKTDKKEPSEKIEEDDDDFDPEIVELYKSLFERTQRPTTTLEAKDVNSLIDGAEDLNDLVERLSAQSEDNLRGEAGTVYGRKSVIENIVKAQRLIESIQARSDQEVIKKAEVAIGWLPGMYPNLKQRFNSLLREKIASLKK